MLYSDFKTRLSRMQTVHRLSPVTISTTYDSDWCDLVRELIGDFVRATEYIYVSLATLTLAENDWTIDLTTSVTTYDIYKPEEIYISDVKKERVGLETVQANNLALLGTGTPQQWALVGPYRIMFDRPCAAGLTGTYVSGLADHPAISGDSTVLSVQGNDIKVLLDYCCAEMAGHVIGDELGLAIANRYQKRADLGVKMILARMRAQRMYALEMD